MHNKTPIICV